MNPKPMNLMSISLLGACLLMVGCSKDTPDSAAPVAIKTAANPPAALRDLELGVKLDSIKGIKPKKLSGERAMFNYEYFGKSRTIIASMIEDGRIYKYSVFIDDSYPSLKTSLEQKYAQSSAKFVCSTATTNPDESVEIVQEQCHLKNGSKAVRLSHMKIRQASAGAGVSGTLQNVIGFELEDVDLSQMNAKFIAEQDSKRSKSRD